MQGLQGEMKSFIRQADTVWGGEKKPLGSEISSRVPHFYRELLILYHKDAI